MAWARQLRWGGPLYELRVLTADGPVVLPAGGCLAEAEAVAAAIDQAVRPPDWPR